ncbi:MAG: hypothetical protein ACOC53_01675 [Candidatus Saliniplasma sp.]
MEEIYSWIAISILLSGTGTSVAFWKAMKARKKLVDSIDPETTIELPEMGETDAKKYFSNVSLVMGTISFTAFVNTILICVLIFIFGIPNEVISRIAIGGILAVSVSSMFTNLGRSMIYDETISGLYGEGSAENFGKHMIFLVLFEPSSMYGLLMAILGLIFSGMIEGPIVDLTMSQANLFLLGCVILGFSASSNILSGRMFNRVDGPVNQSEELFSKKIRSLVIPHLINIMGLVIAIYLMVQAGLM